MSANELTSQANREQRNLAALGAGITAGRTPLRLLKMSLNVTRDTPTNRKEVVKKQAGKRLHR
jgi:hypothetical protein